ncbi:hypothetical protein DB347_18125 [Opitutaceae bacterium EW11]|nr:hypothetical protein DB347_18125 [Opitutaceae bacterium EW11]
MEARWLNLNGHRSWIACHPKSELYRKAPDICVPVSFERSLDPAASLELHRICRRFRIQVIHAHSPKDAWTCVPLRAGGMPVVRSRQITNPVKADWRHSYAYRRGCSAVVAAAECIRRDLVRRNGVDPHRIVVIGEGVDLNRFNPANRGDGFRREFGVGPEHVLFGIVAMIRPEKGHACFLTAAMEVLDQHSHARFVVVGTGVGARELERKLRERIKRRFQTDTAGPIFFAGYRDDVPQIMAALDVLVVPSTAEAQSLVVPQAFATGKAVIASDVGGLPENVKHERTGLLVQPGAERELAAAMSRLVEDGALRLRLGQGGYEHAVRHLAFDGKMEQSVRLYERIAERPARVTHGWKPRVVGGGARRAAGRMVSRKRPLILGAAAAIVLTIGAWMENGPTGLGTQQGNLALAKSERTASSADDVDEPYELYVVSEAESGGA